MSGSGVSILGIFVADTAFLARRMPDVGETLKGSGFSIGPGGKGSNQAVAAARAGADVSFVTKLGRDAFADMALLAFSEEGIRPVVTQVEDLPTGAAFIFVNDRTGANAIIVYPGAAGSIGIHDVEAARETIERSAVFVTQLEQPVPAAQRGLEIASKAGVMTVFNPAPAEAFPDEMFPLCDYIIPNESETAAIVGFPLDSLDDARRAGDLILKKGAKAAIITLGARGVLFHTSRQSVPIGAVSLGPVVDTTGAGDAFVGGFAAALARSDNPLDAAKFGCATAGIAVTRRGTVAAMPFLQETSRLIGLSS